MPRLIPAALALLALLALALPVQAGPLRLVMAAGYGPENFHTQGAQRFADLVRTYSDGQVIVEVRLRQDLNLTLDALAEAVAKGQPPLADVFMAAAAAGSEAPVFGMSSLPLLAGSFDQAREMYNLMRPVYEAVCDLHNLRLLYAAPWPPSGVFSDGPVLAPADLKGMILRVYDANSARFFDSLGAKAQIMDLDEVPFAQRAGRLDAVLSSSQSGMEHRLSDLFSHYTRLSYAYPLNMAVMNVMAWLRLSPAQQAAVTRGARETDIAQWLAAKSGETRAVEFLASRGMTVVEPSVETVRAFQEAAVPMIRSYLHETGDQDVRRAWTAWREGRKP